MSKAIGMVEYKTVSAGVVAADAMVKTSEVSIIEAQTVCPGKYIVIISGDLSAVNAAVETSKALHGKHLINSFVLGNPHKSIFPAIYGATKIDDVSALGIMETYDATSIIAVSYTHLDVYKRQYPTSERRQLRMPRYLHAWVYKRQAWEMSDIRF